MANEGESEKDRFNRFRDSFSKEIAEQQKVMASITTMSSALIALPILFFKDIFKEVVPKGETLLSIILKQSSIIVGIAYGGWLSLVISVFCSLFFTLLAGIYIHNVYKFDYPPQYVDDPATGLRHKAWLEKTMLGAGGFFMLGFGLMMVFVLNYAKISA